MNWTKDTVARFIETHLQYNSFVERRCKSFDVNIDGVEISFYVEDEGAGAYLKFPIISVRQYKGVLEFLNHAIPVISTQIEKQRDDDLCSKYCIGKQYPQNEIY